MSSEMSSYSSTKQSQIARYQQQIRKLRSKAGGHLTLCVLLWVLLIITGIWAGMKLMDYVDFGIPIDGPLFVTLIVLTALGFIGQGAFWMQHRHAKKSAVLLEQFVGVLTKVLNNKNLRFELLKERILTVETNFLANDDELYTKKMMWPYFMKYLQIKEEEQWDKDGKERRMNRLRNSIQLDNVWMRENPLAVDVDDTDFVYLNWTIKRRLRELFFANPGTKRFVMAELADEASKSKVVYERFLRNKKVSKKLKEFKRFVWVFYLNAAAKMKLIAFVDNVLQERPYADQCDEMQALIAEKNEQINKYTTDFWRIHRRSLKFYLFEAIWLALLIPIFILTWQVLVNSGPNWATLVFIIGAGIVVAGEMILVTRQLRDLKSKKLVPGLIASLMGLRHSMCCCAGANIELTKKYQTYFKAVEKRFMLIVTEVEAVKYAKENVTEKVTELLTADTLRLREEKDKQATKYYERFNHYRNQCLKYGALEAFVGLLVFPIAFTLLFGSYWAIIFMDVTIMIAIVIAGALVELVLLIRHIRVARRKELFLLIYQKMSVILSDYTAFSEVETLLAATTELEESIINAASSDNMNDVVAYVRDWQTDNKQRNAQLLADFGQVAQSLPGKATFDRASEKLGDAIGAIEDRAFERRQTKNDN